ncbi:MAG TPA: hypothetical protein G4O00_02050 [Thermoflexia bacterium]|jgi:ribonucleoside-triphosphate reductase|nr:hypothetical protein [Thermoflexia bacterium]
MENTGSKTNREEAVLRVPCEVYSRIVGYLRPVQNWHQGKQQEFRERKMFRVPVEEETARS